MSLTVVVSFLVLVIGESVFPAVTNGTHVSTQEDYPGACTSRQATSFMQLSTARATKILPVELLQEQPKASPRQEPQIAIHTTMLAVGRMIMGAIKERSSFISSSFNGTIRGSEPISRVNDRIRHTWKRDLIPDKGHVVRPDGDEGLNMFQSAPILEWQILACVCVSLSLIDMLLLQRLPATFAVHCAVFVMWIVIALAYGIALRFRSNRTLALEWFSGYMLEWILSMDNLFIFHLVLDAFKTPSNQVHKAVSVGIIGAVLIRMVFFMIVSTLLHLSYWVRVPFGLLLIWSGFQAAWGGDDDNINVEDTRLVRSTKWLLGSRLHEGYDEQGIRAFVRGTDGKLKATLLFLVIASLECTDVLFALDSVSAKVAQIPNQYIAFSSSVLAMYGLRAMFFIVKDLVCMFELLQYGLCLILVFIGANLMMADYINMDSATFCMLIAVVFVVCIIGSVALRTNKDK